MGGGGGEGEMLRNNSLGDNSCWVVVVVPVVMPNVAITDAALELGESLESCFFSFGFWVVTSSSFLVTTDRSGMASGVLGMSTFLVSTLFFVPTLFFVSVGSMV